jgi:hypothetical protein
MRLVLTALTVGIASFIFAVNLGNAMSMGIDNYYAYVTDGPQIGEEFSRKEKDPFEKVEHIKIVNVKDGYVQYQRVGEKPFLDMGITNYSMQVKTLYTLYIKN